MNILKRIMELPLGPMVWAVVVFILPLAVINWMTPNFRLVDYSHITAPTMVILYLVKFGYNYYMVRRDDA